MAKAIIIVAVDIDWITPAPQYPPVVEDVDSYEDVLDQLIAAGCTSEGLTYVKSEFQSPKLGSDQGYVYEVVE